MSSQFKDQINTDIFQYTISLFPEKDYVNKNKQIN